MTRDVDREVRRRSLDLIDQLAIPADADTTEMVARVAAHRGRPIDILTAPDVVAGDGVCGLVLTLRNRDIVITAGRDDRVTVAHELGHLLFDHAKDRSLDPGVAARLVTGIDPATVLRARRSSCYSSPEEYEAEYFARMLVASSNRRVRGTDSVAERLFGSF